MDIENALTFLGFKENDFSSPFYRGYQKNEIILFVFESSRHDNKRFASASGEFEGGIDDLIGLYYTTEGAGKFNENQRKSIFYENHPTVEIQYPSLKPIPSFNLYTLLLQEGKPYDDDRFHNIVLYKNKLHLFFMDEEPTAGRGFNILGVLSYDIHTKKETILAFSDLSRSIYFSTIGANTQRAILFNSIEEMLAFSAKHKESLLYVLTQQPLNTSLAKTLNTVLTAKGLEQTMLGYPDSLSGYLFDFAYLQLYYGMEFKEKFATLKISLLQSIQSENLIVQLKRYRESLEKASSNLTTSLDFLKIQTGLNAQKESCFIIEIPKIANMVKGLLVMMNKYLFTGHSFKLIKPHNVTWFEASQSAVAEIDREYKFNLSRIKESNYQLN